MRSVTEERDPTRSPSGEWVAVHHRVLPPLGRGLDEFGDVEPVEAHRFEQSADLVAVDGIGPVLAGHGSSVAGLGFEDNVDERPAILRWGGDRVDDGPLAEMADDDHRRARQARRRFGEGAPHRDSVPQRRTLARAELRADGRMDPVGSDEYIPDNLRARREVHRYRTVVLGGVYDPMIGMKSALAETIDKRTMQHAQQASAMNGVLRPAISRSQTSRLSPDPLPVLVEHHELARRQPRRRQLLAQTELGQLTHRVGQHVYADAELFNRQCRLENLDVDDPSRV